MLTFQSQKEKNKIKKILVSTNQDLNYNPTKLLLYQLGINNN